MRYFVLSLCILGIILAGGYLAMNAVEAETGRIARLLEQAEAAEGLEQAMAYSNRAEERWKADFGLLATVVDHAEMEEITVQFALLHTCVHQGETEEYRRTCRTLVERLRLMSDGEKPTYYNLL